MYMYMYIYAYNAYKREFRALRNKFIQVKAI